MSAPAIPLSVLIDAQRALTLVRNLSLFAPQPDQVSAARMACAEALGRITYYVNQHTDIAVPLDTSPT